jgi:hypothetical protein
VPAHGGGLRRQIHRLHGRLPFRQASSPGTPKGRRGVRAFAEGRLESVLRILKIAEPDSRDQSGHGQCVGLFPTPSAAIAGCHHCLTLH